VGTGTVAPDRRTAALAVGLALAAAVLVAPGREAPVLAGYTFLAPLAVAGGLAALFCVTDLALLHVEVHRQAYSVTLAGLPLVLGMLLCGPRELVAVRVLGSAVAFATQRTPLLKAGYNLAAYAAEAALDVTLVRLLLGHHGSLTPTAAVVCYPVVLAVDSLMSLLVLQVISWHQGRLTGREAAEVFVPALVCSLLTTTAAFAVLLLAAHGLLGAIVLVVFTAVATAAYRGFQLLHRRHRALEQVHAFVGLDGGPRDVEDVAGRMLGQVRSLMRATSAELLLVDGATTVQLSVGVDDVLRVEPRGWASTDRLVAHVRAEETPFLLPAGTRRSTDRDWLRARGVTDAVVVPLPRSTGDGALMVFDRLGDTGSFTNEDESLLATLAGHLSVAVRSATLVERLRYEATHDALTGLANRALLEETVRAGAGVGATGRVAVLLLDLDRFKEVNDTLGHHVGDELLQAVAARIARTLPPGSTVARLGGDEFAALVPDAGDAAAARALACRLADQLALPVELAGATLTARASIGVAVAVVGTRAEDLLRHADTAMYAAKAGSDAVVVYSAELDRGRAERLALLADLHLALDRGELELRYQPKLDLVTDRVSSVEALVRWRHPRLGLLVPDVFIPLAEANGLIAPLTRLVLAEALRQCAAWRNQGIDVAVAVNLSARTVNDPDLPEQVSAALLTAGVPADRLILEITESAVMDDPDGAVLVLERIAAIGVALSLDDFGTGYSSLAYLQRLPVSEVKIDRSFITGLRADRRETQVLVTAIVNLATGLGHRVVAEGAEDQATVDLLRELGCQLVQGYHIGRPETADQVADCIRAHPGRSAPVLSIVS